MEYVYLENAFVKALSEVFQFLITDIMGPVIKDVLEIFINYFTNIMWNYLSERMILLFTVLCSLVDFIGNIFNVFAGVSPVVVSGKYTYLLDAMFQMNEITTVFTYITVMSVAICFIFTIYKTAKSISDMALEDKNPVSKVMKDGLKASITFMIIPFLCVFLLQLSSAITSQANNAFAAAQGGDGTIGTILFLSASMDADKDTTEEKDLISGVIKMESGRNPSFQDSVRSPYLDGSKDYRDLKQVKKDFHVANFSYVSGFASGILLFFVLTGAVLLFIRRIFELLLLYIVSPFFVSTIPLDDGATFAKWREMFVAKFFSGFGTIFSMKYYMMLIPHIASSNLQLYDVNLPNGLMINNVLRIFLIVGGAWAVYKSQSLILQILNPNAGMAEMQAATLMTGMVTGAASMALTAATGGAGAAAKGGSMAAKGAGAAGQGMPDMAREMAVSSGDFKKNNDENQAYRG